MTDKESTLRDDYLRARLQHDPVTGEIIWSPVTREDFATLNAFTSWQTRCEGKAAARDRGDGYHVIAFRVEGQQVKLLAHRVMWFLHYEVWPKGQLDHISGDPSDNRIANLRDVSASGNRRNMKCRANGRTGVPGVSWSAHAKRWLARITYGGKQRNLGYYLRFEDAVTARQKAAQEQGYHKNHGLRARPAASEIADYIADKESERVKHRDS